MVQSANILLEICCVLVSILRHVAEKGKSIASFSQMFRRNFLPKHRLLMGEHPDDITNSYKKTVHQAAIIYVIK